MKELKEIYCDLNAQMTEKGYSLERRGSLKDLESFGLSFEESVGKKFRFFMDDTDDDGSPNDIMFEGVVIFSQEHGFLAERQSDIYWRSDLREQNDI